MGYYLLRSMKVQVEPGKVELRQAGAPVPEAATWPNLGVWIRRGYIGDDGNNPPPQYDRSKLKPNKKATTKDGTRGQNTPNARKKDTQQPKPKQDPAPAPAPEPEPVAENPIAELLALSRSDLNSLATEHGIEEAARFANKEAVAKAILEAQS